MPKAKKKLNVAAKIRAPKELTQRKLDELAQEMVTPLQEQVARVDSKRLKERYGKDIGKIAIHSMHDQLIGHLGAAGYESKLWEKACC